MKEKPLIVVCLILVFLGLVIMFFSSKTIQPKEIKIADISDSPDYLVIRGNLTKIFTSESGTTFLKIEDETGAIDVVVFKNSIVLPNLEIGKQLKITGKPQKYKEKMEVIAFKVRVLA